MIFKTLGIRRQRTVILEGQEIMRRALWASQITALRKFPGHVAGRRDSGYTWWSPCVEGTDLGLREGQGG